MKRLCLVGVGLLCAAAAAQAQTSSVAPSKIAHPHAAKAKVAVAAKSRDPLGMTGFSDPYAPPVGPRKTPTAQFPVTPTSAPVDPKGGLSISAGQDSPDDPMTGGLQLRF